MAAFAEVSDLEARWRPLSATESTTAAALLDDASVIIRAEVPGADDLDAVLTKMVACSMVKRAMIASGSEGIQSQMNVAGPFTQQRSFSNPMGNLYLTKQERKMLGVSAQQAFMVDMGSYADAAEDPLNAWEIE